MATTATRPQLQYLHDALEELKAKNQYFHLRVLEGEQKPVATFDGKEVINLSSNNYLGLTTHPKLRRAAIDATRKYGVGSGAVRTITGTMKIHMELEERDKLGLYRAIDGVHDYEATHELWENQIFQSRLKQDLNDILPQISLMWAQNHQSDLASQITPMFRTP